MSKIPPVLGVSHPAFAVQAPAFAAELAKIEVDPDTGQTTIHDFVVVQDAGKAINPLGVEGQMQGGAVQSIGIALTEAMMYDKNGRLLNPSLLDYRKLTALICQFETIIAECPRRGPSAPRVGELSSSAPAATPTRSRTRQARLTELPMSPERIALALVNGKH
jgi:CO/xanthine dehydrogenase Mo-binding subunit